jgi:hypothetical protein
MSEFRCEVRRRSTPPGTWAYWIFRNNEPTEGSLDSYASEADAFQAGYAKTEQLKQQLGSIKNLT